MGRRPRPNKSVNSTSVLALQGLRKSFAMFVSEKFVFLELQKTASSHIVKMLANLVPGERVGQHNRLNSHLLRSCRKVVGSVRDPWDWYLSLWSYGCCRHGGLYHRLTGRAGNKIADRSDLFWQELYSNGQDPALFRRWLRAVHDPRHADELGQGYGGTTLPGFAGFYTFRYLRLFSRELAALSDGSVGDQSALTAFAQENNVLDYVIRNESLERDFIAVLRAVGYPVTDEQVRQTKSAPRTNTSSRERDSSSSMYDASTARLVAEREIFIARTFNYECPYGPPLGDPGALRSLRPSQVGINHPYAAFKQSQPLRQIDVAAARLSSTFRPLQLYLRRAIRKPLRSIRSSLERE